MKCGKPSGVTQILIGLHRVGIVGLREALKKADESNLRGFDGIADCLIELLTEDNYIPASHNEAYRRAIYREFLRHRGQDMREYYSTIEVSIRGEKGSELDRFVDNVVSVFGEFELKPDITYVPVSGNDPKPELLIGEGSVARGNVSRQALKSAIGRRISEW